MKKLVRFSLAALLLGATLAPSAEGIVYSDRASWEAAVLTWSEVDLSGLPTGGASAGTVIGLPSTKYLTFDSEVYGYGAGEIAWSGGNTPSTLLAIAPGNGATASAPIMAFGLEMQPFFDVADITLTLSDGSFVTHPLVDWNGGAMFFGWSESPVVSFTITTTDFGGVVMGRMVEGPGDPVPTPDAGSLTLATGLLWAGMMTIRRRQRGEGKAATA